MADPPGLVRRGKRWIIRVRVPDHIRPIIRKTEVTKSLRTTSHAEARLKAWNELGAVAKLFRQAEDRLRQANGEPLFPVSKTGPSPAQVKNAALHFLSELEAGATELPIDQEGQADLRDRANEEAYFYSRPEAVEDAGLQSIAAELARDQGLGFPDAFAFIQFCGTVQEVLIEHSLRRSALLTGEGPISVNPAFRGVVPAGDSSLPSQTLEQAIAQYMGAMAGSGKSEGTQKQYRSRLGALREIMGANRAVGSITRADMRAYVESLAKLPANAAQRFPGLTASEAMEAAARSGAAKLSPKSIRLYCDAARAFFGWLLHEELISKNPALKLPAPKLPRKPGRRSFTEAELKVLLAETKRAGREGRDWMFWCVRIALLQGLRLTEVLGLQVRDVEKIGKIWSFRVRENEFRNFKTDVTERDVPIHPGLLSLGIQKLAEGRPPGELLLSDVPTGADGRFNAAQKRLARLIRKHVTSDPKVVFHSTRHSFRDETRNCGLPREMITRLGGWSGSGAAMDDYGDGYSLEQLKAGLAKVRYNGADFD